LREWNRTDKNGRTKYIRAGLTAPETQKPAGDAAYHLSSEEQAVMRKALRNSVRLIEPTGDTAKIQAALNGDCGGGDHPPIEGLEAAINNSIMYPMVNDVGFQSEHDRRVVMQAARRYLALTADNAKRDE